MRDFILSASFLAIVQIASAQTEVINTTLNTSEPSIAYIGIPNIFKVTLSEEGGYQLKSNLCTIQNAEDPDHFIVIPHDTGIDTFSIIQRDKIIFTKIFRLNYLPLPVAILGALKQSHASKEEIISAKELLVKINNCKCISTLKVTGYTLKINSKKNGEKFADILVEGNKIPQNVINMIRGLSANDVVSFDHIRAIDAQNSLTTLPSFSLIIK